MKTISKASFKIKLFVSLVYYALIAFLAIQFVPDIIDVSKNILNEFSMGTAAVLFIFYLLVGIVLAVYIVLTPLVFLLEDNYEDEALNEI